MKTHPVTAADLLDNEMTLRREKRFRDIEAAFTAFLTHRAKDPDPWLYETLAIAIAINGGDPARVEQAFNYAADQALRHNNVVDLTRVADRMFIHHLPARVPELLERAWTLDPLAPRPLVMAIQFAGKTRDPRLMSKAVEQLFSLGWPGVDEPTRVSARSQVEDLASTLKADGRDGEARELLALLADAEPRDLFIRLTWKGDAWIDLVVDEPLGATASYLNLRTSFGGAIVKSGRGKHPESVYVCPRGFDGPYKVRLEVSYNNKKDPAREVMMEIIMHEGTTREHVETKAITVAKFKPLVVKLEGGRRKSVLPYVAPPIDARDLREPPADAKTSVKKP
jgi:hypothetical protein